MVPSLTQVLKKTVLTNFSNEQRVALLYLKISTLPLNGLGSFVNEQHAHDYGRTTVLLLEPLFRVSQAIFSLSV